MQIVDGSSMFHKSLTDRNNIRCSKELYMHWVQRNIIVYACAFKTFNSSTTFSVSLIWFYNTLIKKYPAISSQRTYLLTIRVNIYGLQHATSYKLTITLFQLTVFCLTDMQLIRFHAKTIIRK